MHVLLTINRKQYFLNKITKNIKINNSMSSLNNQNQTPPHHHIISSLLNTPSLPNLKAHPHLTFIDIQTIPDSLQYNLLSQNRVIKFITKDRDPSINIIRAFYYQLLRLCFQLYDEENAKDYLEITKGIIFDTSLYQMEDLRGHLKYIAEFFALMQNENSFYFYHTLHEYQQIDEALIQIFLKLLPDRQKQGQNHTEIILNELCQYFQINLIPNHPYYQFQESNTFLYVENQENMFVVFNQEEGGQGSEIEEEEEGEEGEGSEVNQSSQGRQKSKLSERNNENYAKNNEELSQKQEEVYKNSELSSQKIEMHSNIDLEQQAREPVSEEKQMKKESNGHYYQEQYQNSPKNIENNHSYSPSSIFSLTGGQQAASVGQEKPLIGSEELKAFSINSNQPEKPYEQLYKKLQKSKVYKDQNTQNYEYFSQMSPKSSQISQKPQNDKLTSHQIPKKTQQIPSDPNVNNSLHQYYDGYYNNNIGNVSSQSINTSKNDNTIINMFGDMLRSGKYEPNLSNEKSGYPSNKKVMKAQRILEDEQQFSQRKEESDLYPSFMKKVNKLQTILLLGRAKSVNSVNEYLSENNNSYSITGSKAFQYSIAEKPYIKENQHSNYQYITTQEEPNYQHPVPSYPTYYKSQAQIIHKKQQEEEDTFFYRPKGMPLKVISQVAASKESISGKYIKDHDDSKGSIYRQFSDTRILKLLKEPHKTKVQIMRNRFKGQHFNI